jgi:hypothetical protein
LFHHARFSTKFGAYIFLFCRPDMLENTTCSNSQSE